MQVFGIVCHPVEKIMLIDSARKMKVGCVTCKENSICGNIMMVITA